MPRRTRHHIPHRSYHLVLRGNNDEPYFIDLDGYQFYLDLWQEFSEKYGIAVHAYCLMANSIHFLVMPGSEEAISSTMKNIGSCYARFMNKHYRPTGTLREARYKSSLIQSERYLLPCQGYIELNPVRAALVGQPEEYQWSSYNTNAGGELGWLKPHVEYERLGSDVSARAHAYRELFLNPLNPQDRCAVFELMNQGIFDEARN